MAIKNITITQGFTVAGLMSLIIPPGSRLQRGSLPSEKQSLAFVKPPIKKRDS